MASLLAATIASATAIFIAVYVYRRQKILDARYRLNEEVRTTCAKIAQCTSSIIDIPAQMQKAEALEIVGTKLSEINFYENLLIIQRGSPSLISAAQKLSRAYSSYLKLVYEESRKEKTDDSPVYPQKFNSGAAVFAERAAFVLAAREHASEL